MNTKYKLNFGRKEKLLALIGFFIIIAGLIFMILKGVDAWFETHDLHFNQVIKLELKRPIEVRDKEVASVEIIRILESVPAPEDLETDPEKYIYRVFGIEHYRMAIAVSECEGLNHPPDGFNTNTNGSIDVGYMRINSVHFKTEGCSLQEVVFPEGNIDCGYKVWDRADGEEGNGRGSFSPWVGYTNGCALTKYK